MTLSEMLIDMFLSQSGLNLVKVPAFYPKPGGAPANVTVAAARLGKKSAFPTLPTAAEVKHLCILPEA